MKTIRGIYNNLSESTYNYVYNGVKYYFSSKVYMEKFINRLEAFIDEEVDKMQVKFKTKVFADNVFAIKLYTLIEKRGFLIEINGKEYIDNIPIDLRLNI